MENEISFEGKWVWEKSSDKSRYIEFVTGRMGLEMRVYTGGTYWEDFKKLNTAVSGSDDEKTYTFHNGWLSSDGRKYFQLEASTQKEWGKFINAMEFEITGEDRIKQLLVGYRFDKKLEKWVNFKEETYLIRLEE
jgi:hypothetical protein